MSDQLRIVAVNESKHFYPLLIKFGLEALSEADSGEIEERLEELGVRDANA